MFEDSYFLEFLDEMEEITEDEIEQYVKYKIEQLQSCSITFDIFIQAIAKIQLV